MDLFKIIEEKKSNIGSLTSYIKKREELLNELDSLNNSKIYLGLGVVQKIWYYMRNDKVLKLCICGKHKKWQTFKEGWRVTCNNKTCIVKQRELTNLKKYGCSNPSENKEVKEKRKKTNIEKYGFDTPSKNKDIQKKILDTKLNKSDDEKVLISQKYINTWDSMSDDFKEDIKRKKLETWNNKSDDEKSEVKKKRSDTLEKNYGVRNTFDSPIIREKN